MKPRCDPVSDYNGYLKNEQACHNTAIKIVEQLGQVIEIRHKIGEARMTPEWSKTLPSIEKELSEAAMPILDTYSREKENCEKTDNTQSCIYAEQFRSFIKFFGPVIPEANSSEHSSVLIEMAHLKSGYIVVPLEPKSSGYEVLLDTAANCTAISVEIAGLFKSDIRIMGQAEYASFVTIKGMSFNLGGIKFEPAFSLLAPVVDFLEGSDERHKLVALLGADFLFHRSWVVNYDKSNFVMEQDAEKEISKYNKWTQVPLFPTPSPLSYVMGVEVSINGNPFRLALDTGSSLTTLIEQCPIPEKKASGGGFLVSLEGVREKKEFKDVPIKFGKSESIENISIVPKDSVNAGLMHEVKLCGQLGANILSRYNYMYDPKTLSLYIRPRDDKNIPRFRRVGFVPKRIKQEGGQSAFVVAEITPGTPAEEAGLKSGDIIIELNGTKSDSVSMLEFMETAYLSQPKIPVTIIRDGETKKLTLRFKK